MDCQKYYCLQTVQIQAESSNIDSPNSFLCSLIPESLESSLIQGIPSGENRTFHILRLPQISLCLCDNQDG